MAILETKGLSKDFGGMRALNQLDININEGEILGLVGPNGSGKTTWINVVSGFLKATAGSILYKGQPITGLPPYQIAEMGIIRTFQLTSLFPNFTVRENLIAGRYLKSRYSLVGSFLRSVFYCSGYREEERKLSQKRDEILAFFEMEGKGHMIAANLPTVDQRKLEIAIAIMTGDPKLLLLDEPASGMNPEEQLSLVNMTKSLQQFGITLVIVEHNMRVIMRLCNRIVVINYGNKIAEGTPEEIATNEGVISAYLGRKRINA